MGVILHPDAPPSGEFHLVARLSKIAAILVNCYELNEFRFTGPINHQLIS